MCLKQIKSFFNPPLADILMNDDSIYIDEGYFNKGLKGKYLLSSRLTKEKVGAMQRQIDKKIYDLWDNDLYRYLQKRMRGGVEKNQSFEQLIKNIEKKGFDPKSVIICKHRSNLIKDGQHRAIYLLWKYGPDYEVNTLHVRVKDKLMRHKIFPFLRK